MDIHSCHSYYAASINSHPSKPITHFRDRVSTVMASRLMLNLRDSFNALTGTRSTELESHVNKSFVFASGPDDATVETTSAVSFPWRVFYVNNLIDFVGILYQFITYRRDSTIFHFHFSCFCCALVRLGHWNHAKVEYYLFLAWGIALPALKGRWWTYRNVSISGSSNSGGSIHSSMGNTCVRMRL